MNFLLTEEQEMTRQMVRDFAEKEVKPGAGERDDREQFAREIFDKMGELGLTGIPWPEEYGGAECDFVSYVIAVEELSRVDAAAGTTLSAHISLAGWPLFKYGSEEQKKKFLEPMALGEKLGAYALTEPAAGTDAAAIQTTAVLDGDSYVINGGKTFITNAIKGFLAFYRSNDLWKTPLKRTGNFKPSALFKHNKLPSLPPR